MFPALISRRLFFSFLHEKSSSVFSTPFFKLNGALIQCKNGTFLRRCEIYENDAILLSKNFDAFLSFAES